MPATRRKTRGTHKQNKPSAQTRKAAKTMKGGHITKHVGNLTAETLLETYGRPKTKKYGFLGKIKYGDFDQKQASKDNEKMEGLSNEKKTELCRELTDEKYNSNEFKPTIKTQLKCDEIYSTVNKKKSMSNKAKQHNISGSFNNKLENYHNVDYNPGNTTVYQEINTLTPQRNFTEYTNPEFNEINNYIDRNINHFEIFEKNIIICIITFNNYTICNITINNTGKRENFQNCKNIRYLINPCNVSIQETVKKNLREGEFFIYKSKKADKYVLCNHDMCYQEDERGFYFNKLDNQIKILVLAKNKTIDMPVFFNLCGNILLKSNELSSHYQSLGIFRKPIGNSEYNVLNRNNKSPKHNYEMVKPNTTQEQRNTTSGYQEHFPGNRAPEYAEPDINPNRTSHYHGPHVPTNATAYEEVNFGNTG